MRISIFIFGLLFAGCMGRRTTDANTDNSAGTSGSAVVRTLAAAACDSLPEADPANRNFERHGPFVENDTTFLYQSSAYDSRYDYTSYCRVFIERNRQSPSYRLLDSCSTPTYDEWNRAAFAQSLLSLKERHPEPLPVHSLGECPRVWIPVSSFRSVYYVDMLDWYPVWICDSLFVRQMMDGPYASLIEAFERVDPTHYRFRTTAGYRDVQQVDLFIVDSVRKTAVFAFGNDGRNEPLYYGLYAPLETAREMDLVEWECSELPDGDEVDWDKPDFEELIAQRRLR